MLTERLTPATTPSLAPAATPRRARPAARPAHPPWPWLDRAGDFSRLKAAVLAATFVPALVLLGRWAADDLGVEPLKEVLQQTGLWCIRLLLLSMAVTPLRQVLDWPQVVLLRRMLGLAAVAYAVVHLGCYIAHENFRLLKVASEIVSRFYLTIGFVALLGLAALGWTSTDGWMRRLGRNWKRLHRLIFPIAILGILHFFLHSKSAASEAVMTAGAFVWLVLWRRLPAAHHGNPGALLLLAPLSALLAAALEYAWYALATSVPAERVLLANLDVSYGLRPALWVGVVAFAVAVAAGLRRLVPRLAGATA
jgi:methionine sulfoxide reductase heme-binding subunit